ncbi:MAG: SHOCT domain-containing protein, partial [Anaerolineae bacterium]
MGDGMWIGSILLLLLIFLVGGGTAATVWFVARGSQPSGRGPGEVAVQENPALETLRQRYARGEIDREEFPRMREELQSQGPVDSMKERKGDQVTNMRRTLWLRVILLAALALGACGQAEPQDPDSLSYTPNTEGYADISVDQLAVMMEDKDSTLVNVHIPYEGEIPETDLFIPYDEIQDPLDELPARNETIVLYCRSGSMSTSAAEVLVDEGYT